MARLHFESDRAAYGAAHALLRWALYRASGLAPQRQRFATDGHGRPQWAAADSARGLPSFNLSHARGLVAVAVGDTPAIGVDVESFGPRWLDRTELARSVLAAPEFAWTMQPADARGRGERFLRLWTLKEALVKAAGRGLSIPPGSFALSAEPPRLLACPDALRPAGRWRLEQWPPCTDGWAALAIDEPPDRPTDVRPHHFDSAQLLAALAGHA
jgi:4'-phosphopantetheinyl transferase